MTIAVPTILDIQKDSKEKCAQFDVYLNGKKQTQCVLADSDKGYVIRYKTLYGVPVTRGNVRVVERIAGKVEIVLKDEVPA